MPNLIRDRFGVRSLALWLGIIVIAVLVMLASLGVFTSRPRPKPTTVAMIESSRYGSVLVVGGSSSGGLYHFPLYEFTGDVMGHFGCGTTRFVGYDLGAKESVPLSCTGPEGDLLADISSDDWPALTSKAPPVAGRGVDPSLLGTVYRKGIGHQVTYAGHPLYLYDQSSKPFDPQGENLMETVSPLPPWHGYWYAVSSTNGAPSPGVAALESESRPVGVRALAVREDGNVDPIAVSVYEGLPEKSLGSCDTSCQAQWTPVLSSARPRLGAGVDASLVGVVALANGDAQVTYAGHPLYLYNREIMLLSRSHRLETRGSLGNGAGKLGPTGAMSLVVVP